MAEEDVHKIATLLHERNVIDEKIAAVIDRPMTAGHLGQWIAAQAFDIELETSAITAAIDGRFRAGPLQGRTVNVKWYLKREGLNRHDRVADARLLSHPGRSSLGSDVFTRWPPPVVH